MIKSHLFILKKIIILTLIQYFDAGDKWYHFKKRINKHMFILVSELFEQSESVGFVQ